MLSLLAFLAGCQSDESLVVYCEPSLATQAEDWVASYKERHAGEVKLVSLSSEVAAQHLRYGQPVDIWIMADPGLPEKFGISAKLTSQHPLGADAVVKAECIAPANVERFKTQQCWMKAASDTPLRTMTDAWLDSASVDDPDSCFIIANFDAQVRDYMLRGWVRGGYVWESFVSEHPGKFKVLSMGPTQDPMYLIWKSATGRNPAAADAFLEGIEFE